MAGLKPFVRRQVTASHPIVLGDTRITLQTRTLSVGWSSAGIVWRHPIAALAEADGRAAYVRIYDLTRLIELGLLGLGLALVIVNVSIRRKEHVS
jgi:hypothetical protein